MSDDGITLVDKQIWIRSLKEAIASGALRVKFADRDVTYRSLQEMREILQNLEDEVAAGGGRKRKHVGLTTFGSGR